jgi:UDP-3-O-acyl-N-acetylglucosamine deacetylase
VPGQTTIRSPARFSHRGLATGRTTSVRLRPGPPDSGIQFNGCIPARLEYAFVEQHQVGLRCGNETVIGVEHLLAACYGLGIDNLEVEVTGGEIPFGDGSALPFTRILQAAGRKELGSPRMVQTLVRPVVVWSGDAFVCALPVVRSPLTAHRHPQLPIANFQLPISNGDCPIALSIACLVSYPEAAIGEQSCTFAGSPEEFLNGVSAARTFGYWPALKPLPAWLEGSVRRVGGMIMPLNPRLPNEQARHKALDLLGDLCLLGRRLRAHVFACKSGHSLHHELIRKLEEEWT